MTAGDVALVERLHGLRFAAVENPEGLAQGDTVFEYRVDCAVIEGDYRGGPVAKGHVVGHATAF